MQKEEGIVKIPSHHSVDETVDKLKTILKSKGVTLFALVDHSGEAEKVGMKMPPTKLLIFGNPKGGTPLMLAAPSAAIDLPLKILVAEDSQGKVWISYNSPEYLKERHGLPDSLVAEHRRRSGVWRPPLENSAAKSLALRRSPRRCPVLTSRIANHAARLRYPTLGESRTREADTGRRAAV